MAGGVGEFEGVVVDVGVAVEGLGGIGGGDDGIGLDEAGQFGVPSTWLGPGSIAGLLEIEAGVLIERLAGIAAGDVEGDGVMLIPLISEGAKGDRNRLSTFKRASGKKENIQLKPVS